MQLKVVLLIFSGTHVFLWVMQCTQTTATRAMQFRVTKVSAAVQVVDVVCPQDGCAAPLPPLMRGHFWWSARRPHPPYHRVLPRVVCFWRPAKVVPHCALIRVAGNFVHRRRGYATQRSQLHDIILCQSSFVALFLHPPPPQLRYLSLGRLSWMSTFIVLSQNAAQCSASVSTPGKPTAGIGRREGERETEKGRRMGR